MPSGRELTAALAGIGMRFAATPTANANIEDTLVAASVEGIEGNDLRVLSVLTTWLGVHFAWVNVDRLYRVIRAYGRTKTFAYWAAMANWLKRDRRFGRLAKLHRGGRVDLLATGTEFQIARRGEDERFVDSPLRVPAGVLRDRGEDVVSPQELARQHATYRQRVLQGPSYRADMWAAIEANPELSASEIARQAYGSFATAWRAKHDWALLHPST